MCFLHKQKWLGHDLEVAVSVEEVRRHRRQFLDDRKDLTRQLHEMKQRLEDAVGPSSSKVKVIWSSGSSLSSFVHLA